MSIFPKDWLEFIGEEKVKMRLKKIEMRYNEEKEKYVIYPPYKQLYRALELTGVSDVKVVIIGQDPYHGSGQANGLAFSVSEGVKFPPSLRNIFTEVQSDIGTPIPLSGELDRWAEQGVLLLNSSLSVRDGEASSHSSIGWQDLTQDIINTLSDRKKGLVYILWGSHAKKIAQNVNNCDNYIIHSVHPSPLSAYRGFFGSKPFSKTNNYLKSIGEKEVNW